MGGGEGEGGLSGSNEEDFNKKFEMQDKKGWEISEEFITTKMTYSVGCLGFSWGMVLALQL